jgi:hypothetical protein
LSGISEILLVLQNLLELLHFFIDLVDIKVCVVPHTGVLVKDLSSIDTSQILMCHSFYLELLKVEHFLKFLRIVLFLSFWVVA